jgi:Ca-activated chloride channel family protein
MRVQVVVLCLSMGSAACSAVADDASASIAQVPSLPVGAPAAPGLTTSTASGGAQPFVTTASDPYATFAADVDTASYDILRRSLLAHTLPPPSEVRIEEYINYFHYDYAAPEGELPFAVHLSAGPNLSAQKTQVLRVGIAGAVAEKLPANVVFLVDVSGSMASTNKLPLVQRVLTEALSVLDAGDLVSIVTYAGDTRVVLEPTKVAERARITRVVSALSAGGGTNGASGIALAYGQAQLGFLPDGINHVVLCTDGDFNLGVTSDDELVKLIARERTSGITLTALGVGERNNDAMMERVSDAGNGIYSVLYDEDQAVAYAHQRLLASMLHVAKDVKIQLELNPDYVYAYRLLGYTDRLLADHQFRDDAVDAGEIGSGHQVTALFELALSPDALPAEAPSSVGDAADAPSLRTLSVGELARVSVRYKRPGAAATDPAAEVASTLRVEDVAAQASDLDDDAVWALGVATVGQALQYSPYVGAGELATVTALLGARAGTARDRRELVALLPELTRLLGR